MSGHIVLQCLLRFSVYLVNFMLSNLSRLGSWGVDLDFLNPYLLKSLRVTDVGVLVWITRSERCRLATVLRNNPESPVAWIEFLQNEQRTTFTTAKTRTGVTLFRVFVSTSGRQRPSLRDSALFAKTGVKLATAKREDIGRCEVVRCWYFPVNLVSVMLISA